MSPVHKYKKSNTAGMILLVAILVAQLVVLPAAWGQDRLPTVDGLEFEDGLLEEPWSNPIERFELEDEPLAPIPDFNFVELSVSDVLAPGVGTQAVSQDVDVSLQEERHLLALQAVATAELARATVDGNISAAEAEISQAGRNISAARVAIRDSRDDIAAAQLEVAELDAADDEEAEEQADLQSEIDSRRSAIVEIAMQAFTGEDLELETLLLDPESTEVLERRIVIGQVREIHAEEIEGFEQRHRESQARRDQLAAERAPIASAIEQWQEDIVRFGDEIVELDEQRVQLRADIVDLEARGDELDVIVEDTLAFAEATAAQYQVVFHQRLASFVSGTDLPLVALNAYARASGVLASEDPGCGIHWSQLAGIGRIESFHGYFGSSTLDVNGNTTTDILGLRLDGRVLGGVVTDDLPDATGRTQETAGVQRLALIRDSDNGVLDGDRVYDRAVGPMQFIPTTWDIYGADGNGDGVKDPQNIYDAALASARYLCAAPGSMLTGTGEQRAYFAYNHDLTYSANVTREGRGYHNDLDVSPESGAFASFARRPAPVNRPVAEVLGTTQDAETPDDPPSDTDEPTTTDDAVVGADRSTAPEEGEVGAEEEASVPVEPETGEEVAVEPEASEEEPGEDAG